MSDFRTPKVSICIPVYNGSDYIADAIDSILAQTYRNFNLIICDNCSTDDTANIVLSFKDDRIKYVRNPKNLGLVGNANRCLELSNGEYICIFHHDDVMLSDNLESKVHILDKHPEVGFVHSNIMLIDSNGKVVNENIWNKDSRQDYIEDGLTVFRKYISYLPFGASIFIGSVLARRSCYAQLGGFNPDLPHCNDSEMWMRMLLFYNVACIGTPLVKYRVHRASASTSWGDYTNINYIKEHYKAARIIFNNYKEYIPQWAELKRQLSASFCERLLALACSALVNGNDSAGKAFLREAMAIYPFVFKKVNFWKALLGCAIGKDGIRLYQAAKKYLTQII